MKKAFIFLAILLFACTSNIYGQPRYEATITPFSAREYNEFCPVLHDGDLVFCTNQGADLLIVYKDERGKGLLNIFKVKSDSTNKYHSPEPFSRNLLTPFNDGPAAFSQEGKLIVFSRNLNTGKRARNIVDPGNNLGLFFAGLSEGEWIETNAFIYNNSDYSITSPCFSPDGQTLFFGSNMPGGFGGTDIYRCRLMDGQWSQPENLGETINTPGNELYPFIPGNNRLFFASDGHGGLGKKDLFLSTESESGWSIPVHLESPINSSEDDFGLFTDESFSKGYFSSNREGSDDIYSFSTRIPQLYDCDTLLKNNYCFEFWDDRYPEVDSLPISYEWEFSDGTKIKGERVEYCLPGAGAYWAKLNIIDSTTDKVFITQTTMEFELVDHIQPFITCPDTLQVKSEIFFSGLESYLPDYTIEEYIWDFGDGNYDTGPEVNHQYKTAGNYYVKLGLKGYAEDEAGQEIKCVIKPVIVITEK
jgi:hypothetical protein